VLVHNASHETYVAERNLEPDTSGNPVLHPLVTEYFDEFRGDHYARTRSSN
jgi:heat shock protein HspQ